ncbi:hypothetical protein [Neptunitalea chrysea]|nr:hypothetical protein [Neptunitalea chrysea]
MSHFYSKIQWQLLLLLLPSLAVSQINENFDNGVIPTTWTVIDGGVN